MSNNELLYIVFVDYGTEGWKIYAETQTFLEAYQQRESAMSLGNENVLLLKRVEHTVDEK